MTMNKLGMYFVALLLAAIAPLQTLAAEDAKTAIENLLNTYQERLSNDDLDGILDLYSANPVFIPEYAHLRSGATPCARPTSGSSRL